MGSRTVRLMLETGLRVYNNRGTVNLFRRQFRHLSHAFEALDISETPDGE
jgi:hypothetical protein